MHNIEKEAQNKRETVQVKRSFIAFGISVREKSPSLNYFFLANSRGKETNSLPVKQGFEVLAPV